MLLDVQLPDEQLAGRTVRSVANKNELRRDLLPDFIKYLDDVRHTLHNSKVRCVNQDLFALRCKPLGNVFTLDSLVLLRVNKVRDNFNYFVDAVIRGGLLPQEE